MFRKKNSISTETFTKFAVKVENDKMRLTLKKGTYLWINYQLQPEVEINQRNIVRAEVKKSFANVVYKVKEPPLKREGQVMAIDLGIINTAATVKENGEAKIYTRKGLLAIQ